MTKKHEPLEVVELSGAKRVLLSGDVHGSLSRVQAALGACVRHKADAVLVLGDFGYWEHTGRGRSDLDSIDKMAARSGAEVLFIDGNHDNHPLLWETYCAPGAPRDADGFAVVRPHVKYIERGHRWTWGTTRFLALGGAPSADKDWRLDLEAGRGVDEFGRRRKASGPGTLWWDTEEVTTEQAERAKAGGHADVLLTHDAPAGVTVPVRKLNTGGEAHRDLVREVLEATTPTRLFHGHWHIRYDAVLEHAHGSTRVTGLGDHRTPLEASLVVLDA